MTEKKNKRPLTLSRALILKEDEIYQYFSIEGADNENTEFKYLQRHPAAGHSFRAESGTGAYTRGDSLADALSG